jgi:hypothetical protein
LSSIAASRAADDVVHELRHVLAAGDFRGVEAAVDVDERLALANERLRLDIRQALWMREPPRDFPVAIDALEILGRRHQREVVGTALRASAGLHQHHAIAGLVHQLEVLDDLLVVGQPEIRARLKSEHGLGRGNRWRLRLRMNGQAGQYGEQHERQWNQSKGAAHGFKSWQVFGGAGGRGRSRVSAAARRL